jgi:Tol biopolymer transport system component
MCSPDGRWLAYVSDESGQDEIYVQAYPGPGARYTISTEGGREPLWAADGTELFYRKDEQVLVVPIQSGPELTLGTPRVLFKGRYASVPWAGNNYDVSPDGQRFVMLEGNLDSVPRRINVVLNWVEELKTRLLFQ